jgi:hypothetical protein
MALLVTGFLSAVMQLCQQVSRRSDGSMFIKGTQTGRKTQKIG